MLLVSLAMFVPAALMWRMARLVTRDTDRFMQIAQRATGTVVSLEWRSSPSGAESKLYAHPQVAFSLPHGQQVHAIARTGTFPRPAKVGDVVDILDNPRNPQDMDLARQAPRTLMRFGYRYLAITFALFGICGLGLWWLLFRWWGIPA